MPHVPEIDQSVYSMVLLITNVVAAQDATPEVTSRYVDPTQLADEGGQFVDVDGASVYYIERGDPENPAVLLLHGFLGSVVDWTNVIDVLAEAGYHVIAFDRPPFANSRADALRALAQALAGAGYIVHALRIYVFETLSHLLVFLSRQAKHLMTQTELEWMVFITIFWLLLLRSLPGNSRVGTTLPKYWMRAQDRTDVLNIFGAFELKRTGTHDEGFEQAVEFATEYNYTVGRRGKRELMVMHPHSGNGYLIDYDNQARQIANVRRIPNYAMELLDIESLAICRHFTATRRLA